jgi:N-acylethanolamine-hydrolysing acid amidase
MLFFSLLFFSEANAFSPPSYTVDLSAPPSSRWSLVQRPYASLIKPFAESYASQLSPAELQSLVDLLHTGYLVPEFAQELQALALAVNITYNQAVFLNFMYEWNAHCTSIVARLANGTVIHGRNLDYSSSSFLRETTVQIHVYHGTQKLYTSVGFAWYLGVGTGIGRGFSVSQNERDNGGREATFDALLKGYQGDLWVLRKAFSRLTSFDEASWYLKNSKVAASTYYIVAGEAEGVDIARERDSVAGLSEIGDENWFVVQTNSDNWLPDPDGRRDTAIEAMDKVGRENMSVDTLLQVLQTFPVLNPTTVFTSIMVPSTGFMMTTVYEDEEIERFELRVE